MVTDVDELGMLTADMDSPISYAEGGMTQSQFGRHHGRHGHMECGRR